MTADELTAFITRMSADDTALLVATRTSVMADFAAPILSAALAAISAVPDKEHWLWPTGDGLVLYYHRQDPTAGSIVFASHRTASGEVFTPGSQVVVDGLPITGLMPQISADGQRLYWLDYNNLKLYSAQNSGTHNIFALRSVSSLMALSTPVVSGDELTLYYAAGVSVRDIFVSARSSKEVPFDIGIPVPNINSVHNDVPLFVTSDGCLLFLESNRPGGSGGYDIWVARRPQ